MIELCAARVTMTATFPLTHRCPYRYEDDHGTVEITWTTAGDTLELHALAAWLGEFATEVISHEDLTESIVDFLDAPHFRITDVTVVTRWTTAGAEVVCRAVPREPIHAGGA